MKLVESRSRDHGFYRGMFEHILVKNPLLVTTVLVRLLTNLIYELTFKPTSKPKSILALRAEKRLAECLYSINTRMEALEVVTL